MNELDNIKSEIAKAMRDAGNSVIQKHLASELGEESARKVIRIINECASQGLNEDQVREKLQEEIVGISETKSAGIGIGIGVNGAIYLKVTADVMS